MHVRKYELALVVRDRQNLHRGRIVAVTAGQELQRKSRNRLAILKHMPGDLRAVRHDDFIHLLTLWNAHDHLWRKILRGDFEIKRQPGLGAEQREFALGVAESLLIGVGTWAIDPVVAEAFAAHLDK